MRFLKLELLMFMIIGLFSSSCENLDVIETETETEKPVVLTIPNECEELKDIRYEMGHASSREYQLLCKSGNNLILFHRDTDENVWTVIKPSLNLETISK